MYKLIPIRESDMLPIKEWRNAQIALLRQKEPLSDKAQMHYFVTHVKPAQQELHPKMILFSFLKEEKLIGYGGLVHIDWTSHTSELSFLLDPDRMKSNYELEFPIFLDLIMQEAKKQGIETMTTEVYDFRERHIEILENYGFTLDRKEGHSIFHSYAIQ